MIFKKQPKRGVCHVLHCTNKTDKGRKICHKHKHKQQRENDPVSYALSTLKQNAKRRKKEFTLTLEEFRKWCADTGYINKKGRGAGFATIDRKNQDEGYHIWNIQIMNSVQNIKKYYVDYYRRQAENYNWEPTYTEPDNEFDNWSQEAREIMDDCPF